MTRIFLITIFILVTLSSWCCTCSEINPQIDSARIYDLKNEIFLGKVISIDTIHSYNQDEFSYLKVSFSIKTNFTLTTKENTIALITGLGNGDCGFRFDIGTTYLVTSSIPDVKDGFRRTSICKPNLEENEAQDELQLLHKLLD